MPSLASANLRWRVIARKVNIAICNADILLAIEQILKNSHAAETDRAFVYVSATSAEHIAARNFSVNCRQLVCICLAVACKVRGATPAAAALVGRTSAK